jgi:hypothetical protein
VTPIAEQAKDLLGLIGTPSALIGGSLLAFASRGIKDNRTRVDRSNMIFALLASFAAIGVAGSLVGLMAPIAWRSITAERGSFGATLLTYWMIFMSIVGSLAYSFVVARRCLEELRRPER